MTKRSCTGHLSSTSSTLVRRLWRGGVFAAGLGLAGACDVEPGPEFSGDVEFREVCPNGVCLPSCECQYNGPALGLGNRAAIDLGGALFEGTTLLGMNLSGGTVTGFSAPGGLPTGVHQGVTKSGAALIGMKISLMEGPRRQTLVLSEVDLSPDEFPAHRVKLLTLEGGSICTDAQGQPDWITLVEDAYWDGTGARIERPDTLSFSCGGGAIAKAAHSWGYKPYYGIAAHHQAVTRMIRADYCGTGQSNTVDGVVLSWTDTFYQGQPGPGAVEAVWDEDGAVCLNTPRAVLRSVIEQQCTIPLCTGVADLEDVEALGGLALSRVLQ